LFIIVEVKAGQLPQSDRPYFPLSRRRMNNIRHSPDRATAAAARAGQALMVGATALKFFAASRILPVIKTNNKSEVLNKYSRTTICEKIDYCTGN